MPRLTERVHALLADALSLGDVALDATCGNGHDTLFLAQQVGPTGRVYGFDLQGDAIALTQKRLSQPELDNVTLHLACHSRIAELIPLKHHGCIRAATMNLGYLPGGDKTFVTRTETTLAAIESTLNLLAPGGILTVVAYVGHPGGREEADAVARLLHSLPPDGYQEDAIIGEGSVATAPQLFVVRKVTTHTAPP